MISLDESAEELVRMVTGEGAEDPAPALPPGELLMGCPLTNRSSRDPPLLLLPVPATPSLLLLLIAPLPLLPRSTGMRLSPMPPLLLLLLLLALLLRRAWRLGASLITLEVDPPPPPSLMDLTREFGGCCAVTISLGLGEACTAFTWA